MGIDAAMKRDAAARLRRIAGQVGGIERMLETDRDGVELMRQVKAVEAALREMGRLLLVAELEDAVSGGDTEYLRRRIDELTGLCVHFSKRDAP